MTIYSQHFSTRQTSQQESIQGRKQIQNSAGGFSFEVNDWTRLDRFLLLGAEGNSYYVSEKKLTIENAQAVLRCLNKDGPRAVRRIVEISESGRAPKNDAAIFALAMAASYGRNVAPADLTNARYSSVAEMTAAIIEHKYETTRAAALEALPRVARTGTALFAFAEAVQAFRGWGRGLRRAIADWYLSKEPKDLAYQVTKYRQRNGWSHRDLLRLSHPKATEGSDYDLTFLWATKGTWGTESDALRPIIAFEAAKRAETKQEIIRLIRDYSIVRECVPTQWLTDPEVWEALLEHMPLTAMVRNLATMTRVGLLKPLSNAVGKVLAELTNEERIRKSRLHPLAILMALRTYAAGRGERGQHTWMPVPQVIDALNGAFYRAFGNVTPTGKRWLLALDVSGSMARSMVAGMSNFSAREASAAMALVTAATESNYAVIGFTGRGFQVNRQPVRTGLWGGCSNMGAGVEPLNISPRQRLNDVVKAVSELPMGPTDCSLPMLYALENKIPVDVFVVYTDSETWHSPTIHPCQALQRYREKMGIPAKLIVSAFVSNGFSIADPSDAGMLDVCGLDSAVPQVMADFATQ